MARSKRKHIRKKHRLAVKLKRKKKAAKAAAAAPSSQEYSNSG